MKITIYTKLAKVKSELGKISKDSTNPFFKSKYFDINQLLEHVEPLLEKNGLLCLQPIVSVAVRTEIIEIETGEMVCSEIKLSDLTDPQKMGSQISYFRRYTLSSLLAIQAEDDDSNKASKKTEPKKINLFPGHPKWDAAQLSLQKGNTFIDAIKAVYSLTAENEKLLCNSK